MNNKPNILFFIHLPPPIHGVSKCNEEVYNLIRNAGYNTNIVKIEYNKKLGSINTFQIKKIIKYISLWAKFFCAILKHRPKYIYYTIPPTGLGLYKDIPFITLIKICRITPIYHLHGKGIYEFTSNRPIHYRIHRFIYSNSIIIHLSHGILKKDIIPLRLRNSKNIVINNGSEKPIVLNNHLPEGKIKILFFSNIVESKGIFDAIEIISRLDTSEEFEFHIIGAIPTEDINRRLNTLLQKKNLVSITIIHGPKYGEEKFTLLQSMDILLYPSKNDALPITILEALSSGLFVIASDQGAIPEIITSSVGRVFPTANIEVAIIHLNEAVAKIALNRGIYRQECIDYVEEKFTIEIFREKILNFFSKLK